MSHTAGATDHRALIKSALIEIDGLQSQLDAERYARTEPIAVVGLACRFPSGENADTFWRSLRNGVDAVSEVPADRWSLDEYFDPDPDAPGKMSTRYGAFLKDVDKFDARFFRISPREAVSLDPQQRLMLEVAWESLENAGQSADELFDSATGVFVGLCHSDYLDLLNPVGAPEAIDEYFGTGNALSVAAGRLSYVLGLRGPSMTVDTACSSSLVAVHLAVESLRKGECRMALAGGVNLMLAPGQTITFSKARMMAADGRCKTFDAAADGYVRGEGCGIVVLKRLSDAIADRDNIVALIRSSAVNQDGRSGGLTAPNGPSQEAVIGTALLNAGLEPNAIDYVEAHGTGTSLGDPIEVHALMQALARHRNGGRPLQIGSVKTNVGHLEAAAGVAGLIKLILSLVHAEIPPHLHFHRLNPHISLNGVSLEIPVEVTPWPAGGKPRIGAVSSFGFGGTNAHLIVEEAPPTDVNKEPKEELEHPQHLLVLSAKTHEALLQLATRFADSLGGSTGQSLADVCYTAGTGRVHHDHRLAVIAPSLADALDKLRTVASGASVTGVFTGQSPQGESSRQRVAFLSADEAKPDTDGRQTYLVRPTLEHSSGWPRYLESVADLYVRGASVDWVGFFEDAPGRRVPLPTYPFQRERYWFQDRLRRSPAVPNQANSAPPPPPASVHPLLGHRLTTPLPTFQLQLEAQQLPYLRDFRVHEMLVLPPAAYVEMALAAAKQTLGSGSLVLTDVAFLGMLVLPGDQGRTLQTILTPGRPGDATFHVFSLPAGAGPESASWSLHATGKIARQGTGAVPDQVPVNEVLARLSEAFSHETFYQGFQPRGLRYGSAFQGVLHLRRREGEALGRLRLPTELELDSASYRVHPGLLDAALQVLAAALPQETHRVADASAYLAVGLDEMRFHASPYSPCWSHAVIRPVEEGQKNVTVADVRLLDEAGTPVMEIRGLRFEGLGGQVSPGIPARKGSVPSRIARNQPATVTEAGAPETSAPPKKAPAQTARRSSQPTNRDKPFRETLRATEPDRRQELLQQYLSRRLAEVLGLGDAPVDVNEPLYALGIDSLMVFKLGAQLEREVGIGLRMTSLLEGPSVSRLAAMLLSKMDET